MHVLDLALQSVGGDVPGTMVTIDAIPLQKLVGAFETNAGMDLPGEYGPLYFERGRDLYRWFVGRHGLGWPDEGRTWLLGCPDCGADACWPLECAVVADDATITWRDFSQPHRPDRDYSGFGPFVFELGQFEAAVATLEATLGPVIRSLPTRDN